jgi:hypothetical protein
MLIEVPCELVKAKITWIKYGFGPAAARARVLVHEVLDRGDQAFARGAARCASQLLDRGA